ncbi:MAG: cytochrome c oxidase subunit II [Aquisalimonadaceae bacterium]
MSESDAHRRCPRGVGAALAVIPAVAALSGCETAQSILNPANTVASSIARLWWVMLWVAAGISLITFGLALYTVLRPARHQLGFSPRIIIIAGGLIWPAALLLPLLAYAVAHGHGMLSQPSEAGALEVHVTGHQWWWEIRYPDVDGAPIYDANELHIPAGRPVDVILTGADVIHSFWVPRLGGKRDALPGTTTVVRLTAEQPGVFRGQCAEFCGAQHARMVVHVTAHSEAQFNRRMRRMARMPRGDDGGRNALGRAAFGRLCAHCHSVDPRVRGNRGPNLAAVAERLWLGAGALKNGDGALLEWLQLHQTYKPGNRMPSHNLVDDDTRAAIAAFLENLR